jgi:hypothetical protein
MVMRLAAGLSMVALALTLSLGLSSTARADDAKPDTKATGTVSGKVVDSEGKAVKGATVVAVKPMERLAGGANGGGRANRQRPEPLAKAETGEDGTYKLENVPAGKVTVVARMQDVGFGRSASPVDVTGGQESKVDDIKLAKGQGGRGRPGGRQNGGEAKPDAAK